MSFDALTIYYVWSCGFFFKQYNKSALLCFLLEVWNCIICTPCISSPSKRAKEASAGEQSSPTIASLHDYSFAVAFYLLFSVSDCFPFTYLYYGFLVVYLLSEM